MFKKKNDKKRVGTFMIINLMVTIIISLLIVQLSVNLTQVVCYLYFNCLRLLINIGAVSGISAVSKQGYYTSVLKCDSEYRCLRLS